MDKARAQIELSASIADELRPIVDANAGLRGGSYSGGLEEYAEAVVFEHFVHTGDDRDERGFSRGATTTNTSAASSTSPAS